MCLDHFCFVYHWHQFKTTKATTLKPAHDAIVPTKCEWSCLTWKWWRCYLHKSHFDLCRRNTMAIDIPCVLGSQRSALGTSCSRFLLRESLNKAWFLWTWKGSEVQKDEWYCVNCRQLDTITTSVNWSATCLPVTPQKLPLKYFNCYEWPIYKQACAHQYFMSKEICSAIYFI